MFSAAYQKAPHDSRRALPTKVLLLGLALAIWAQATTKELDFIVLGVIASNQPNQGFALLKEKSTGKVLTKKEGSALTNDLVLTKVATRFVNFTLAGKSFRVAVGSDMPENSTTAEETASSLLPLDQDLRKVGDELRVDSRLKNELIGPGLQKVLMQAAVEIKLTNGEVQGFVISEIEPGSIYEKAGFKNGDLITHINDIPLKDAASAVTTLTRLKSETSVSIKYKAGGVEPKNLQIVVE